MLVGPEKWHIGDFKSRRGWEALREQQKDGPMIMSWLWLCLIHKSSVFWKVRQNFFRFLSHELRLPFSPVSRWVFCFESYEAQPSPRHGDRSSSHVFIQFSHQNFERRKFIDRQNRFLTKEYERIEREWRKERGKKGGRGERERVRERDRERKKGHQPTREFRQRYRSFIPKWQYNKKV